MSVATSQLSKNINGLNINISNVNDLKTGDSSADLSNFVKSGKYTQVKQVHGTDISIIKSGADISDKVEADGLITNIKGLTLVVKTADCVPVLILDTEKKVVGAIHSGWRGTRDGIVKNAIIEFVHTFGSDPKKIHVLLGPAINPCCYEVQRDLEKEFKDKPGSISRKDGKLFLDLKSIIKNDLENLGVNSIENIDTCTYCSPDLYPSYRRDKTDQRIFSTIKIV